MLSTESYIRVKKIFELKKTMEKCACIMVFRLIIIFLVTVSSNQIILFNKFVSIINTLFIVASARIIKMVQLNGQSARSLKCHMP